MHAGDLPPLIRCNGGTYQCVASDRFKVQEIIGRTVVIYDMPDDFNSQPSVSFGTKIACGVKFPFDLLRIVSFFT
ncbi:MAG: superoxide dismutase family protein [Clostridia bacterium]|nr:superoxide dismutase family protein [Clostridia bacterium]